MRIEENRISIIGLGYVGLPLAVEFGKTFKVIGYDINEDRVKELIAGHDSTLEINSKQLLDSKGLSFSHNESDLDLTDIFIITVPTPVDEEKIPDLKFLKNATKLVARHVQKGSIIIFESTVFPGCTEEICVPILEEISGLKYNKEFFCGYSPERINPGDKINTITKIKKIVSGSNPETLKVINELYSKIIDAGVFPTESIKVAETAKVIENTQRDLNIAFVNELSFICDKLDIDTMDVLEAAGSKWNFIEFKPGIVGGHCIGVDPYYLIHKAKELGSNLELMKTARKINDHVVDYLVEKLLFMLADNNINLSQAKIGIMGLTFKENCPDIRNTKVIDLIHRLWEKGLELVVEDSWADYKEVEKIHGVKLKKINKKDEIDCLIVAVGHEEYRNLTPIELKEKFSRKDPLIIDVKSIYDKQKLIEEGFKVFRL